MEITMRPVTSLHNVGTQREQLLHKLGIQTLGDLLQHYPRGYIDLSAPCTVDGATFGQPCAVKAELYKKHGETRLRGGIKLYKATAVDEDGTALTLVFFNNKFALEALTCGRVYLFYGRVEGTLLNREMHAPQIFPADTAQPFSPCYPLTKGLSNKILSGLIQQALTLGAAPPELLPSKIREKFGLPGIDAAIHMIHAPSQRTEMELARKRLIFEELFTLAAGIGALKARTNQYTGHAMQSHSMQPFFDALPFSLTGAQQRAIEELIADLQKEIPANRLVQGDVGSGKTIVAAAGAYFAFLSGAQTALMAPTELLAQQHYNGLSPMLENLGMHIGLLTGSMTAAKKRAVYAQLQAGEIDLCIGTHALLSAGVMFRSLGLVITDEQHRFGVSQRTALGQKGEHPHTLVMSATPIPRTLALMVYGELDISVIDELPPNRQPVKTYKISSGKRERAFGFIRDHLKRGLQAYIVCPLVENEEESTIQGRHAASSYVETLREGFFADYTVGLLHGKMKAKEKESIMTQFQSGTMQLLVSTTVIEVGVDVPNAVIMMIENAECFGLSQLHQLRGRVGRGKEQSHCILVSDNRSQETLERLQMMCKTTDGFQIAEYDLQTRGPGNFLGQQQHGLPQLRIADLTTDVQLIAQAQQATQTLLETDPLLALPEHAPLKSAIEKLMKNVGERPN